MPRDSATVSALNGGEPPFSRLEGLIADLWTVFVRKPHPKRQALETAAYHRAKNARVQQLLKPTFNKRKRKYGRRRG